MSSALINVMSGAAIKATKGLLRDFSELGNLQISRKGVANYVTEADTRTEKLLHRELSKARPDFGFLMEESGEIVGKNPDYRFIIDPIDGTSNFIHAVPYFCISIGVEKREGDRSEIIAGVIYDPIHNEMFTAEKGVGAFLNGRKMQVSQRETFEDSLVVIGNPREAPKTSNSKFHLADTVTEQGATLRYFGATALDLAYVAAGRIDACWYYTIQPWDIAAGIILIREAGGMITEMDGTPARASTKALMATNKKLYPAVQKLFS